MSRDTTARPRQDSNLRTRLRRPMLYPLSYEGGGWRLVGRKLVGRVGVEVWTVVAGAAVQAVLERIGVSGCENVAAASVMPTQPTASVPETRPCLLNGFRAKRPDAARSVLSVSSSFVAVELSVATAANNRDETVWFTEWRHRLGGTKRAGLRWTIRVNRAAPRPLCDGGSANQEVSGSAMFPRCRALGT
jgi:hypothetical protein